MRKMAPRIERIRPISASVALVVCLSAMLGLMVTSSSDRTDTTVQEGMIGETPTAARTLALTAHAPILIDGNAGFTNASGVVQGSGTASDPYVIENWDISASTAAGVKILNTDAHFIVRNCYVHDGLSYHAMYLGLCANGTITENNCSNNAVGIHLGLSSDNTIYNNTCNSSDMAGINLYFSNNNSIYNNSCCLGWIGIFVTYSSNNNTIWGNTCTPNQHEGISLFSSNNNNTICNNDAYRISLMVSSNDNTLSNNTCSSDEFGISLHSSNNNTLSNNNCSSNGWSGIYLDSSSGNELIRNQMRDNHGYGVLISSGSNTNTIWNNTFYHNNGASDTYESSHVQACDDGTSNWWNSTNGYGNYWSDWTTPDDVPRYGIVDVPYDITGSAGAKDYYPLTASEVPTEPIPEFGMISLVVMVMLVAVVLTMEARRRKAL
jgi:parallel beta-helix repeat protein